MRIRTTLFLAATAGLAYACYRSCFRPWWAAWGVDPAEAGAPLAGDDLVLAPDHVETRGIDIAAPPEAVWPWLVQMGFGRAGWYSYDRIDMDGGSARSIRADLQDLEVGDLLPTHPDGGFVVREIDPGRSLVVYSDGAIVESQARAAKARGAASTPANLRASGAFLSTATTPSFAGSWAFVIQQRATGSRLIERFRVSMQGGGPASRVLGPALGFGVFLMMRKQLMGIRERVEAAGSIVPTESGRHEDEPADAPAPEPVPAGAAG